MWGREKSIHHLLTDEGGKLSKFVQPGYQLVISRFLKLLYYDLNVIGEQEYKEKKSTIFFKNKDWEMGARKMAQ